MAGLSNIDIEKFFHNETNEDLKKNFKKVISSNSLTRYLDFKKLVLEKPSKYPFAIINTARENHKGLHWISLMNIEPTKHVFLFDSEGFLGFRVFILNNKDDNATIDKVLFNIKKFNQPTEKIKLVELIFPVVEYRNLKQEELKQLTTVAQDLFHLLSEIAHIKKQANELKLVCVENELQSKTTSTCGIFQLYFYKHLFDPLKNSKVLSHTKLNKVTIQTLLNEIFSLDTEDNKNRVKEFAKHFNIQNAS